jgi:type I restriction enzyme S subunit
MSQIKEGYKQTKVGIIPEDWDVVALGELGELFGGGTPSTKNENFWNGDIPWISSSDLSENNIYDIEISRFINNEAIKNSATKLIPVNSILIVSRVGVGKIAINRQALCTSQDFQSLILSKDNHTFIAYSTRNEIQKLISFNQGTSIKGFVKEDLKNLKIKLPPLKEQEKIAEILTTWDNAIIKQQKLIKSKEEQKKGLMQKLLSGEVRFDGFSDEWDEVRLGEVAEIYQPQTISQTDLTQDGYDVYGANGIIGKYYQYNHELEQIAITCRGNTCGTVNYTKPKSWITGNAMVINLDNSKKAIKTFMYYLFLNTNFTYLISGSGQPQITGNIKSHKLELPSLQEQKKIAKVLSLADEEINNLKNELKEQKQQKKALMQKLLTGQVRVKV